MKLTIDDALESFGASARLVYVDQDTDACWFTTRPDWQEQWGDDWHDSPYEHNAEEPYEWLPYMDCPPYTLVRLDLPDHSFLTPAGGWVSVYDVNQNRRPWLMPQGHRNPECVMAGDTLAVFMRKTMNMGERPLSPVIVVGPEVGP